MVIENGRSGPQPLDSGAGAGNAAAALSGNNEETNLALGQLDSFLAGEFGLVQDEIAQAVVAALKLKLLQPPTSKERRTANTEAYNQYLLGKQFLRRNNVDGFRRAKQALARKRNRKKLRRESE